MITVSELAGVATVVGSTLAPELFIPIGILNAEAAMLSGNPIGVPASFISGYVGDAYTLGSSFSPRIKDALNEN